MPSLSSVAMLLSDSPELLFLAQATLVIAIHSGEFGVPRNRADIRLRRD